MTCHHYLLENVSAECSDFHLELSNAQDLQRVPAAVQYTYISHAIITFMDSWLYVPLSYSEIYNVMYYHYALILPTHELL